MARPEKFGHDYFSFYTRSDESSHEDLLAMIPSNGHAGYVAVNELDCLIRGATPDSNGYYIILDQKNSNKLSKLTSLSNKKLEEIIERAIEIGHYDREKFDNYGILTSKRIQEDHINTSVKRNNLLIRKEYMLLSNKDIRELGIKRKMICIDDFYIWKDTQIEEINSSKNDENGVFIDGNNEVNSSINEVNSSNNRVNSSKSTQIKINKIKENKIKENEITLNSESNGNCNGNCNSNDKLEGKPQVIVDYSKLHIFLQSLLKKNLFSEDPTDIYLMNEFLFDLQLSEEEGGYGYSFKQVMRAAKTIRYTLKIKTQEELNAIEDKVEYVSHSLLAELSKVKSEVSYKKHNEEADIDTEDESKDNTMTAEELEDLKIKRVMKKHKCTYEEAIKIMEHDKEVRKNVKLGDDENV